MPSPVALKLRKGGDLDEAQVARFESAIRHRRTVARGKDIITSGESPSEMHVVLQGYACRYKLVPDGGRQIMAWLIPGDFCDLQVRLLKTMDHSIAALTECEIGYIQAEAVDAMFDAGDELSHALSWATLVDEAILREWLVGMGRRPADRQIAHLFCELLVRLRTVGLAEHRQLSFPLTQQELADTVGLTEIHVNRVLQQLRAAGLINLEDRRLTILDEARLRSFASFDSTYLHLETSDERLPTAP